MKVYRFVQNTIQNIILFQRSLLHGGIVDKSDRNISCLAEQTSEYIDCYDMLEPQMGLQRGTYNSLFLTTIFLTENCIWFGLS